jgi:glycosyltransferase involved in cell wall biosynthesis
MKDTGKVKQTTVFYVLHKIEKALAYEWIISHIDPNIRLSFVSLNSRAQTELAEFCQKHQVPFYHIYYNSKWDLVSAWFRLFLLLLQKRPDVVHAHMFEAGLIGITGAWAAAIRKRIYTRHYSTQHHEYAPQGVKYDKIINRFATQIIAISENVRKTLTDLERCPTKKIALVHHGFSLGVFEQIESARIENIRNKYNIHGYPVVGVISRYLHLKGIQYIIPAFKKLLLEFPDALLLLANARGEYKQHLHELLSELPAGKYIEIDFESDIVALYKSFDIFIHVPINEKIEAFGQIYVEALAAGIPSIFTMSGVATEFIHDKENALVVDYKNEDQIYRAMKTLIQNQDLRNSLIKNGRGDLNKLFNIDRMIDKLEIIYTTNG